MSDYQPIACGLHSQLELWAMHQAEVDLTSEGQKNRGKVVDVLAKNGAEYLVLKDSAGETSDYRLDLIEHILGVTDGISWP